MPINFLQNIGDGRSRRSTIPGIDHIAPVTKVICVPMKDGKALGEYDDFMTGFVTESEDVWGRLVGVTVDKQGSLIVSDDAGNCLWRVRHTGSN